MKAEKPQTIAANRKENDRRKRFYQEISLKEVITLVKMGPIYFNLLGETGTESFPLKKPLV